MRWLCSRCRTLYDEAIERCPHDGKRVVADLSGRVVAGRYALRELLGVGGMDSSVWLAWQTSTHREVAVKLLPPADGPAAERFARGARIASNLNHPNITTVHDYGQTEDGQLFLVMEHLVGRSLHGRLKEGPLRVEQALHVADQVLRALDHAHANKVVHRDIKPGNLFLVPRNDDPNYVKVLDFGIARYVDDDDEPHELDEITQSRQVCGTPQYMAPEQVSLAPVDARADLYSLGIVLYRMLSGSLPFRSSNHQELFRHHVHSQPPPLATVAPDVRVPQAVEQFVLRALEKDPDDRFPSAADMRLALRQVRAGLGMLSEEESTRSGPWREPPPESEPGPRRVWVLLLAALLLFGGAAAAWVLLGPVGPPPPAPPEDASPVAAQAPPPPRVVQVPAIVDAGPPPPADAAPPPPEPPRPPVAAPKPPRPRPTAAPAASPRSPRRPPRAPEPSPELAVPASPPPEPAAPPPPKAERVEVQLLDEGSARPFEVGGGEAAPRPAPPKEKPQIELLE